MPPRAPAGGASAPPAAAPAAVVEPEELLCPVTRLLFRDPVVTSAGNTYERSALLAGWAHRARGTPRRDPLTNEALASRDIYPNWIVRNMVATFLASHPGYTPEGWESRDVPPPALTPAADDSGFQEAAEATSGSPPASDEGSDAYVYEYMGGVHRYDEYAHLHNSDFDEEEEASEGALDSSTPSSSFLSESELSYYSDSDPFIEVDEDFPTESQFSDRRRKREANWAVASSRFEEKVMYDEEEELMDEELREYCDEDWGREHRGGSDTSSLYFAEGLLLPDSSGNTDVRSRSPKPLRGCRPTLLAAVRKMEARRRASSAAAAKRSSGSSSSEDTPPPRHTLRTFQDFSTDRSGSSSASEESVMLELSWGDAVCAWRGRSAVVHRRARMPTPEASDEDYSGFDDPGDDLVELTEDELGELMQHRARVIASILVHHLGNDPGKLLADAEQECAARGPLLSYADL